MTHLTSLVQLEAILTLQNVKMKEIVIEEEEHILSAEVEQGQDWRYIIPQVPSTEKCLLESNQIITICKATKLEMVMWKSVIL